MCELLAISSRTPTGVNFDFQRFSRRGGETGPHADGWGVAWYADGVPLVVRAPEAAATSPWLRLLNDHPLETHLLVSHVRKATRGALSAANTQPFARPLGGRMHVFAHNGDLPGLEGVPALEPGRHKPLGQTDSEHAFGALLRSLEPLWDGGVPTLEARLAVVAGFAARLRPLGPANFLYTDGELLFAHGHRRTQASGSLEPPGLWMLCPECGGESRDLGGLSIEAPGEAPEVLLLASVPLDGQGWVPLAEGEVVVAAGGRIRAQVRP